MTKTMRKGLPKKQKKEKSLSPFDFFKDITWDKKNILTLDNEHCYSKYMIVRILSMHKPYLPLADLLNKYQIVFNNFQFHEFCIKTVPKKKVFEKYIKGIPAFKVVEDKCKIIANYFRVSITDAYDYYKLIGDELVENIELLYGKSKV
jgi:hypothetical protein